jgi:Coenzyme PQQ synthesis protein D (PqqD)
MIFEEEVPVFPPDVVLEDSHILDTVTGDRVRINETAHLMLSLVNGRRTAREIGEAVAAYYGLASQRVISDLLQLAARLNEKCMLNVHTPPGSWRTVLPKIVKLFLIELALGRLHLPLHRKRVDFCNRNRWTGFLSVVRRLSLPATVMGWIMALPVWFLAGDAFPSFWLVASVALAFAMSLVLHEAAHAIVLAPVPAFLGLHGPIFLVGHPRILYTIHKYPYPHGYCRKMRCMHQEEATLSRTRFLKLFFAATISGLSLLSLAGCGGSQGGDEGEDGNGNGKKDNEGGGGGGGGGY